jgi:molecular chaperone GrpE
MADQPIPETENTAAETDEGHIEIMETDVEVLSARVAELEAQLKDAQLRAQAEIRNIQMRAEREVSNAHKFGVEKLAGSLLDVVDNFERALAAAPKDDATKALVEGLQLTHRVLMDALKKFSVEQVDPMGQPFNAEHHQAVATQPTPDGMAANTVVNVFQKGYTLSGRLLRPAMVVVAQ